MAKFLPTIDTIRKPVATEPAFLQTQLDNYFIQRVQNTWDGGHILHGRRPDENSVFFSSNDYLSISQHPALLNAQIKAIEQYGNGQMQSSVFLNETSHLLSSCEALIANHLERQACLLTQSGWCANTGVM